VSRTEKLLIGLEEIAEDNNTIVQHINFRGRTITMEYSAVHEQDGETYIYLRVGMSGRKEVKYFAHETGHIYKGICRI